MRWSIRMREEYDVIVIGAGPAGSIAAGTASDGCEVLLIEKRQEIGAPVRCAEAIAKEKLSTFLPLQKRWIANEIQRARIFAPDGTVIDLPEEIIRDSIGIILERKLFDRELARRAALAGAQLMVRTRATGLIVNKGAIQGVKLNRRGEDFEVRSKVVIGADGVESQVGRWGGINTTLALKDIESCAQYHMENVDVTENTLDFYFGSEAPSGYAWVFPKGEASANVGLGVLGSKLAAKRPVDYLDEFAAKHFPDGQPIELMMGGVPVSDALETIVSDGLMLVGDAAHHTEPLTGGGIIAALESGMIAGAVASKAVRQNDASMKVLREYETEWNSSFGKARKQMYKIKEFFVQLSDDELNRIARVFHGIRPEEFNAKDVMKRLLKKDPRLMFMLRHLL
jgi:digeranylgeranylglycerophospholipid reductase